MVGPQPDAVGDWDLILLAKTPLEFAINCFGATIGGIKLDDFQQGCANPP